jgi:Ankyrin repeats (3 copies)
MPVRHLPSNPNLDHLKHQAKDLLRGLAACDPEVAQRVREFHPRFQGAGDAQIFSAKLSLADAQLAIAREYGFAGWTRLKVCVDGPAAIAEHDLPRHERIEDAVFRQAVHLLDAGDEAGLRRHLKEYPNLARQRVVFEGANYFRNPTLLEFVAENPIRHGSLPGNIVAIARVILDAGAERAALNETLMLVCSGRVARECGVQLALIDLLCDYGAEPGGAMLAALGNGEFEAASALIHRGAEVDLPAAAALGLNEEAARLLPITVSEDRHRALALASQFGRVEIVRALLDAGEDPDRYNPVESHSHSTPMHQAAFAGHYGVVRILVERGARVDRKDILWQGTPADWAEHAGNVELEAYLRGKENAKGRGQG